MATQRTSTQLKNYFLEHDPQEWVEDLLESVPTLDEAWQQDNTVTVGANTAGYDVKFFTNTTGAYILVDASEDQLVLEKATIQFDDSKGMYFGDGDDATLLHDGSTGLELSVADNDADAFEIKQSTTAYVTIDTTNDVERIDLKKPVDMQLGQDHSTYWECFDDFNYQTIAETDTPWVLNAGGSAPTADPAIASGSAYGVITLTAGSCSGDTADDASQLVGYMPVQAQYGNVVFETRLHIDGTAATAVCVNAGFTDTTLLEEPFYVVGTAITCTANDAACFVYDSMSTGTVWYGCAVDSTTEDSTSGSLAIGHSCGTYQTLRLEMNTTGGSIWFFVDGVLKRTLTSEGVSPDVNLYPTVVACGAGSAVKRVDVDYVYYGCTRA